MLTFVSPVCKITIKILFHAVANSDACHVTDQAAVKFSSNATIVFSRKSI